MRNPYRLYVGEPLGEIVFDVLVFPGSHLSHMIQIHRERNTPLEERIKDYGSAMLVEGLKLAAYGMLIHNCYEMYKRFLS
jgi:hypothetical protein